MEESVCCGGDAAVSMLRRAFFVLLLQYGHHHSYIWLVSAARVVRLGSMLVAKNIRT
jgi:hypothetical protein